MKKVFIAIAFITLAGFAIDRQLSVQAPVQEWQKHLNKLEVIRNIAEGSNLGYQEVKFITKSIDSLEMLLIPQLQKQLADTTKRK